MAITISTHLGTTVSLAHNRRDKKFIEKENANWAARHHGEQRIDPDGYNEFWISRDLKESYDVLFSEAVEKFNAKQIAQRHPDRVIKDYLAHIQVSENKRKNSQHVLYEIIYTIGSMNHPVEEETARSILRQVAADFEKRNPNLYVVFSGMHASEKGATHVHISFIPVARTCVRGMETRNSLSLALEQQGIKGTSRSQTAQMLFEKQENQALEKLCNIYGYEVEHPTVGQHREHLSVEEYRLMKSIEEKQAELKELNTLPLNKKIVNSGRLEQLEKIEKKYDQYLSAFKQNERDGKAARIAIKYYTQMYKQLINDRQHFDEKVNEAANKKIDTLQDNAFLFIKSLNLWNRFLEFSEHLSQTIKKVLK